MKLLLNKDQKRLPIGGHHFIQHGITFKAETFDKVVAEIVDFRRNNNRPIGNPDQEVLTFYLQNWPYMVVVDESQDVRKEDDAYIAWRDAVYELWAHPPKKFVAEKEAEDRWKICETCPHLKKTGIANLKEYAEVVKREFILKRGIETPPFLQYCALHRTSLPVLVLADQPVSLSRKKEGESHNGCWCVPSDSKLEAGLVS